MNAIALLACSAATGTLRRFDITAFGARSGGADLCTPALKRAVAAAAEAAPAEVVVPQGEFLTGAFGLATGVLLRLEAGAVLLASARREDYPERGWPAPRSQGWDWDPALIDTANCSDTGIVGEGAVDGQQRLWVKGYDPRNNVLTPVTWSGVHGCRGECRPKLVRFTDCARVTVTGVTLRNSPDWTQLYRRCTDVLLRGITVLGSQQWANNDGVDFESGSRIRVLDSVFVVGDDGIVLASGNTNSNRAASPGLPTTDVLIRNCTISSKSSGIKWEAIDFGGCDHGDLAHMVVEDVRIFNSSRGIGFQLRNGRGSFRNITVRRTHISTVYPTGTNWWGSAEPIWLTVIPSTAAEGRAGRLGSIVDVAFEDVAITAENGVLLSGVGRPVGPIAFRNVSIELRIAGNATCRKGYPGAPCGCTDYRPLDCNGSYCPNTPSDGVVLPQQTAGIRLEGAGAVHFSSVAVTYAYAPGKRPAWWADTCVVNPRLNASFDPWPFAQRFTTTGEVVRCVP